ncbi:BT_3987 domain-containing protein [Fulvivirga ligni]|uniref:BT_3987 domain-containing protein n=1 Tax=Fulvivirga ligni TaxID=2904246 RepID=UPI001F40E4A1|nr:DUF1735 domain-containing protein [Fulvivirga ligni]UII18955.1 DUF1735 domain-containing protein [Fulvivirga ligni]
MKNIHYYYSLILILLVAICFTGCDEDEEPKIYMPDAKSVVSATFDITDTVTYSVSIVGADYPTVDVSADGEITVDFKVDSDKVAEYNQSMGTDYAIMPSDNFSFDATGVIANGESMSLPLKLIIKNGEQLEAFSSYLLPITIDKVNGGKTGDVRQTTYFILTRSPALEDLPTLDRSGWTIAGFSTEEPGEGGGNGLADKILDGDYATFWHSKWAGGEAPAPHYLIIDMGEEVMVHGISIVNRDQKDSEWGQAKDFTVSLSTDGENFVSNGSFSAPTGTSSVEPYQREVRFFLPSFKPARYIKITINDTWGTTITGSIAEVYAL